MDLVNPCFWDQPTNNLEAGPAAPWQIPPSYSTESNSLVSMGNSYSQNGSENNSAPPQFFKKRGSCMQRPRAYSWNSNSQVETFDAYSHLNSYRDLPNAFKVWSENQTGVNSTFCAPADTSSYGLNDLSLADASEKNWTSGSCFPVELLVSNLDQNIDAREMKKRILAWFTEVVMILHVSVFVQSDGSLAATVTVPSQLDAQYAISQLHRKRIGTKRIVISYVNRDPQPPGMKRSRVLSLLREVPGKRLPLFKFRELYERRFQETIAVSELYNMKEIISVNDNTAGRMVCLTSDFESLHSFMADSFVQNPDELKYCKRHSQGPDNSVGWAERDHSTILPNVRLTLKAVNHAIQVLIDSHDGMIPLASLFDCFHADVEPIEEDSTGVPLEHLISCVPGVKILAGPGGFKYVKRSDINSSCLDLEDTSRFVSPPLVGHIALFSKEVVDLVKTFPHCRMLLSRFIRAYTHHFGRQCRVADYGYTKLVDLFNSLSHLIQIMGEGAKRTLTLSHRVQVKRFSTDLLRVLKSQPSKTIALTAFPDAFEKVMGRTWDATDYGVCDIKDLLREAQDTTVVLKTTDEETTIAIPRAEQTAEEMERTRLFATEVVELLRHVPDCKMHFNRFVPAYHNHYGKQCRVAEYGFTKLIELLEAIPHVLQILDDDDDDGERKLQLVEKERLKILGNQIFTLVKNSPKQTINLPTLATVFLQYYGYTLKPKNYGCENLAKLVEQLRQHVKVENKDGELKVILVDKSHIQDIWVKSRKLLWDEPECSLSLEKFVKAFEEMFQQPPDTKIFEGDLQEYLEIQEDSNGRVVKLVPLQIFARDLLVLLNDAGGRMLLANFESAYINKFGVPCRPASFGFPNITTLVQSLEDMAHVKGTNMKKIIVLNKEKIHEIPSYSPAPPQNDTGIINNHPAPPRCAQSQNGVPIPATPLCDQKIYNKDFLGSSLLMGMTPPQGAYQNPSPMIYPGSQVTPNGSLVWSQMWSPQYSLVHQLSPTHYMVPTIPINWGNVPSSPLSTQLKSDSGCDTKPPITIQTLEDRVECVPPNPCELPLPDMLTNGERPQENGFKASEVNGIPEFTSVPSLSKNSTKKRLAVHFEAP